MSPTLSVLESRGAAAPVSISVAMTTYNGARYVAAQLESIAAQTCRPDELVIGDDQSRDDTAAVVGAFAQRHPGMAVRFERNRERLGSTRNFEQVARRCRGDLVVFADQDDLWLPQRLARVAATFAANADASYVFSDGLLIDEDGDAVTGTLFSSVGFTSAEQAAYRNGDGLRVLLRHNDVTGAALAVRRADLIRTLPFEPGWIHDYFIAFLLEAMGRGICLAEPLIRYRCHRNQQVGVARQGLAQALAYARKQTAAYCRREAQNFQALRARLATRGLAPTHPLPATLDDKCRFIIQRARMRTEPLSAPGLLWRALRRGDYVRYGLGWRQAVVDLMAVALAVRARHHR